MSLGSLLLLFFFGLLAGLRCWLDRDTGSVIVSGQTLQCGRLPSGEFCLHFCNALGVFSGEVSGLARVFGNVEEHDRRDGLRVARLLAFATHGIDVEFVRPVEQRGVRVLLIESRDERNRLVALGHLSVEQRQEIDAVEWLDLLLRLRSCGGENRLIHVERRARYVAGERLRDPGRPFDEARHAQAALPQRPLAAAQIARGFRTRRAAVIAAIPEQRVVGHLQLAECRAQLADVAVDAGDLAVVVLVLLGER